MENPAIEKKLSEVVEALHGQTASRPANYAAVARRNGAYKPKIVKTSDSVEDSLDWLRVSVKYLLFDLEATRRENAYLKRLLQREDGE